jgi:hypothetical protein
MAENVIPFLILEILFKPGVLIVFWCEDTPRGISKIKLEDNNKICVKVVSDEALRDKFQVRISFATKINS